MRTLIHKPEISRIDFLDNRFYLYKDKNGEQYFPSCTEILSVYPKGFGFDQWLKDVGSNASLIAEQAADIGTKIHHAAEILNEGQELKWCGESGTPEYSIHEWQMILKYDEFWKKCKPKLIANERQMCSPELKFGGTLDMVVMIGSKRWLLDIKTSNYLHKSHELQLSAYATLWNQFNTDEPIEETGIIWLKATTRTEKIDVDKNTFQGHGWQIKTFDRHYLDSFKIFLHVQAIWQEENPKYLPANKIYPDKIKL